MNCSYILLYLFISTINHRIQPPTSPSFLSFFFSFFFFFLSSSEEELELEEESDMASSGAVPAFRFGITLKATSNHSNDKPLWGWSPEMKPSFMACTNQCLPKIGLQHAATKWWIIFIHLYWENQPQSCKILLNLGWSFRSSVTWLPLEMISWEGSKFLNWLLVSTHPKPWCSHWGLSSHIGR